MPMVLGFLNILHSPSLQQTHIANVQHSIHLGALPLRQIYLFVKGVLTSINHGLGSFFFSISSRFGKCNVIVRAWHNLPDRWTRAICPTWVGWMGLFGATGTFARTPASRGPAIRCPGQSQSHRCCCSPRGCCCLSAGCCYWWWYLWHPLLPRHWSPWWPAVMDTRAGTHINWGMQQLLGSFINKMLWQRSAAGEALACHSNKCLRAQARQMAGSSSSCCSCSSSFRLGQCQWQWLPRTPPPQWRVRFRLDQLVLGRCAGRRLRSQRDWVIDTKLGFWYTC